MMEDSRERKGFGKREGMGKNEDESKWSKRK